MKKQAHKVRSTKSKRHATHRERVEQTPPQVIEVIEEVRTEPGPVALLQLEIGVLQNRLKEHEERTSRRIEEIAEMNGLNIADLKNQLDTCYLKMSEQISDLDTRLNRVTSHLDNTQGSPIAPPPLRPVIGLVPMPTRDPSGTGITITVIGRGFAASDSPYANITIAVLRSSGEIEQYTTTSSPEGTLSYSFAIGASDAPQTYTLAATDGRPNAQDWPKQQLWSNSVSFVL